MKAKNLLKKAFLLLALMGGASSAWADDAVSATQTFTNERATCTWNPISATVAKGNTAGGDGLYFTASASKSISTSGGTIQGGSGAISVVYVQVVSATSHGTITMTSSSDANDRPMYLESYNSTTNPNGKVVCAKSGSTANFTSADVVSFQGGYYVRLSNTDSKDVKIKTFAVTLTDETYPESVAADPVFSLTSASISTSGTSQIRVGSKGDLDGIELSSITYGTSGVVTVDENGVVTPVAAGTTTITFNSSAVAAKYNATEGSSVEVTVYQAIPVFDGTGLTNSDIFLTKNNVDYYDYLKSNSDSWTERTWTGYEGYYLDMKTGRTISIKMKNVTAFEVYLSGTKDRTYTVKVGDAEPVEYIQSTSSGFAPSGVIATGTTDEVTIVIEGGENTLYPVYVKVNPAVTITPANDKSTYVTTTALDFSDVAGLKAYVATAAAAGKVTLEPVGAVPAGTPLMLVGTASTEYTVPVAASASAPTNMFVAGDGTTEFDGTTYDYILYTDGKFYQIGSGTVATNKAYLHCTSNPTTSLSRELSISFGGVTGVENVEGAKVKALPVKRIVNGKLVIENEGVIFNAFGQKVK